jgi:hypothetical protein
MRSKHVVVIGLSALAIAAGLFLFGTRRDLDSDPGYKVNQAKTDIRAMRMAIDLFHAREGRYPTDSEGLSALVPVYLRSVPKDPWIHAYIYRYEGTGMPSLYSSGPNGSDEHGEGDDVTFTSH